MPPMLTEESFEVSIHSDVVLLQSRVRQIAVELGFSKTAQWELSVAISEAATNIIKYAKKGTITIRTENNEECYLEFEAVDNGIGISDLDSAIQDGISQGQDLSKSEKPHIRDGLGCGFGAMQRMLDEFYVYSNRNEGTRLVGKKYLQGSKK
jgi:anti-sigma regulatory factor (Ser/Thr protein kinase)